MEPRGVIFIQISLTTLLFILGINSQDANFVTSPPCIGQRYAGVPGPRGLLVDESNDILVLSKGSNSIIALTDSPNQDGTVTVIQNKIVDATELGLSHGIAFFEGFLYASSATNVYRWPYIPGSRSLITVPEEIVISNIPGSGYTTRTLVIDPQGRLYVSIGSNTNVDPDSSRANIRRFYLNQDFPVGGIDFKNGVVFANGLRNEVGLAFDKNGILWGVENGAENLVRPDLGGDIHNGNPSEELNKFNSLLGTFYGYPYCFSSYNLPGYSTGTQFVWPTFMSDDGNYTDAWCRDPVNNQPPILSMPAHEAPLGIEFYNGQGCGVKTGALPCSATGDAFVAYHGSWDSNIKVGYRVGWLPFNKTTLEPTGENMNIIYESNTAGCVDCFRPVNVVFDLDGHLIISADATNEIFRVYYNATPPPITRDVSNSLAPCKNKGHFTKLVFLVLMINFIHAIRFQ